MDEGCEGEWEMIPRRHDAEGRFMKRVYRGEAEKSWVRHAAEDSNSREKKGKPGGGAAVLMPLVTNAETKW